MRITESELRNAIHSTIRQYLTETHPTRVYSDLDAVNAMDSMLNRDAAKRNKKEAGWWAEQRKAEREKEELMLQKKAEREQRAKERAQLLKQKRAEERQRFIQENPHVLWIPQFNKYARNQHETIDVFAIPQYFNKKSNWGKGEGNIREFKDYRIYLQVNPNTLEIIVVGSIGEILNTHIKLNENIEDCYNQALNVFHQSLPFYHGYYLFVSSLEDSLSLVKQHSDPEQFQAYLQRYGRNY